MSYTIKYFSLQKAELQYEVQLRGGSGDSVQELRKLISKLSLSLPSEDILESHLESGLDLKEVKESLLKSQTNLGALSKHFDKNLYVRTETLLHHIYHRLNRIRSAEAELDVYKICVSDLKSQLNELASYKQSTSHASTTSVVSEGISVTTATPIVCDKNLYSDLSKLKYSGSSCVHSFIQKVDEFVQSRGISFDKILSLAFEIFVDDALHWYRYNKDKVKSWQELCVLLKEDFCSKDYDYRLAAEIRSRTQGERENIIVYISIMHGLFARLSKPVSIEEKLDILLHNIRPCYANTIAASPEIKTIDELISICRNYENIQSRFSSFHEPPSITTSTIAPEFAYNYNSSFPKFDKFKNNQYGKFNSFNKSYTITTGNKVNSIDATQTSKNEVAALCTEVSEFVYCPRCRSNSHSLGVCKQPRFLICFKCGKKDVRYPECPDCHKREQINKVKSKN
ncbi:uncharacterized protein LOC128678225 [Plodia interpunctella]|uniref:uncharacterized protein LOC128678225 n=1 Tax=Plodia interpunctella TaxID=58824 RepID=UPI0023685574|nr:uncharacterized protein LOC128678225 [Plodia interpunctella]